MKIHWIKFSLPVLLFFLFSSCNAAKSLFSPQDSLERKDSSEMAFRGKIIDYSKTLLGSRYRSGGKTPKGFDCSGYTGYVYKQFDIKLGASSRNQATQGKKKSLKSLEPGDLLFFSSKGRIFHVAIFEKEEDGKFWMIHSATSLGVVRQDISNNNYWKKRLKFARDVISP
ncbi:MAG TPA: hypothetical protein DCX89_02000 [Saprospirales bacterium]|nr:hypothetical protein [Saprospirales bacterium]HAY70641.1 hypothetical protein [Saprospirales bacterium]HRQ28541.1 C40 family peptidase [Saprospiraceae bacterium]